jgi:hypothetical protein
MNFVIKRKTPLVLLIGLAASTAGHAQKANVGITTGTLGTSIEISKSVNKYVSIRADMHLAGSLSNNVTLESNPYEATFTPDTKSLLVDIHPFKGAFYVTGGLVDQNINFKLAGKPASGSYRFNGKEYQSSDIGSFTGTADFTKSTAPYLGIGWSNRAKKSEGVALSFEAGVINLGSAKADMSVVCGSALSTSACSTLQSNVTTEVAEINSSSSSNDLYYPVVKLGISYRF